MNELVQNLKKNKNALLPVAIIVFLGVITLLTLRFTQERQDVRSRAAADSAILSFTPTSATAAVNGTFTVSVLLNTGGQAVVGSDILVEFDRNKLNLQSIAKPSAAHATFKTYAPVTSTGAFDTSKVVTQANANGVAEFGIIAFDYAAEALTQPFNGVVSPVATLTFQVKAGATGTSTISYRYVNATSTTDSNVILNPPSTGTTTPEDILAAPTSTVAVTISGTASPQPTPRPSPSATPRTTPVATPRATPRVSPVSSPMASPSGSPNSSLIVKVKFESVTQQTAPKEATLILKQNGNTVRTETITLTANSAAVYTSNQIAGLFSGTYDMYIDGPIHLTKKFGNTVLVAGANTIDVTTTPLITGDALDNERVDIFDYSQLVADFGPRYQPSVGSTADFNIDGDVDIYDYSYLVANFNKTGDE